MKGIRSLKFCIVLAGAELLNAPTFAPSALLPTVQAYTHWACTPGQGYGASTYLWLLRRTIEGYSAANNAARFHPAPPRQSSGSAHNLSSQRACHSVLSGLACTCNRTFFLLLIFLSPDSCKHAIDSSTCFLWCPALYCVLPGAVDCEGRHLLQFHILKYATTAEQGLKQGEVTPSL